jgi:hypothetical protein
MDIDLERAVKIAALNDVHRKTAKGLYELFLTDGVLEFTDVMGLVGAVRTFDIFTSANDPYGEHDFGTIKWEKQTVFWKIDYYDEGMRTWTDPLSPLCQRLMTVMLASEY